MDLGQWLVIGLCVLLLIWYIAGALINYRRAAAALAWLKAGLDELGGLSGMGWLTALHSAGRLAIREARPPFRTVELLFALEARENLLVWAFRHLLGRRDELYVRAELRSAPDAELEAARRPRPTNSGERFDITRSGKKSEALLSRLKEFLGKYPSAVLKVSLQRKSPHVLIRLNLDDLRAGEARALFAALRVWLE
jgi:hypothetical protein